MPEFPIPKHWGGTDGADAPCEFCGQGWTLRPPYADEEFDRTAPVAPNDPDINLEDTDYFERLDEAIEALVKRSHARGDSDEFMQWCEYDGRFYLNHTPNCPFVNMMNGIGDQN